MTITLPDALSERLEALARRDGREPADEALVALERGVVLLSLPGVQERDWGDFSKYMILPTAKSRVDFRSLPPAGDDFLADRNQGEYEVRLPL